MGTAFTCSTHLYAHQFLQLLMLLLLLPLRNVSDMHVKAQLSSSFYETSCPTVATVVEDVVRQAVEAEARMAASLLRLHFHDCFVHGCDGSVLLDDTATVIGEKTAPPNNNSIRGLEVVDEIKSAVEAVCYGTVSCADILALAAKASVVQVGGPSWMVLLGRRDATSPATIAEVSAALPSPFSDMPTIISSFAALGLNVEDTVALSGGHTIGQARCVTFKPRLYNFSGTGAPDPTIDPDFLASLQGTCPEDGDANTLQSLDVTTPDTFDIGYYNNLQINKGLLLSDQELISDGNTTSLAALYASNESAFFLAFAQSMVNMGNISPLTGSDGEIRLNCHVINSA
ncbi:hypothetical protein GOP47_0021075 [Adiantum capillus-veneris]|uniref:Peroxidase n=1 Tax=Adiantum capillus-veneris TaxID=13818 RepID=A0A9D4Z831_ADICA|nr:hypothetical protein GOP47_0021075 [Adiantum capillus-veneris]